MLEKVNFLPSYNVQNIKHIPKLDWQVINPLKQEMNLFYNSSPFLGHDKELHITLTLL